jgi:hypothetical protein
MVFILIMIFHCEISGSHGGSMKIRVSWDIALCSLRVARGFGVAYCLHHQGDAWSFIAMMKKAVCTSETSVYFNKTTWRYIPEGSNLNYISGFD